MKKLLLLALFSLLGCSENPLLGLLSSDSSSSDKSPTDCLATYTGYDGAYDLIKYEISNGQLKITVDHSAVLKYKSNPGCTQKIQMAAFEYNSSQYSIDPAVDKKPIPLSNWEEITPSKNIYFLYPSTTKEWASLCVRALSNLAEESKWYCRSAYIKGYGGSSTPTPTPTPTAIAVPSTPANLRYSRYDFSSDFSFSWNYELRVTKYWYSIYDTYGNLVISATAVNGGYVSIPFSKLTAGRTYSFRVVSEISGVYSSVASLEFYFPVKIFVTLNWMAADGSKYLSCKETKSFLDIDFVTIKKQKYPTCLLISLGADTYKLDCSSMQTCSYYSCTLFTGISTTRYCGYWTP